MTAILIAFFLTVALMIVGVTLLLRRIASSPVRRIGKRIMELSGGYKIAEGMTSILRAREPGSIPVLNRILEKLHVTKKLERILKQADSKMTVSRLILFMLVFGLLGLLVGSKFNFFMMIILTTGLGSIPLVQVQIQRSKRLRSFIRAFPDSIDMMASAIRAGHAFNQAMQLVGNEAPDPVGTEFKHTYEQYNLGLNLKDVLLEMTERVDSQDLKLFVTAILLQKETGGNLTEILDKISYTIRERFKLIGQIRTFTAQGRMSAGILGCLPVGFVLIISGLNPKYLEPMFHDKLGHYLILISLFLQVFGFFVINKIVKIKYQ
jgi:tight adherence protein B